MIIKISNKQISDKSMSSKMDYHCNKVEKGVAQIVNNNTLLPIIKSDNVFELIKEVADSNDNVKSKYKEIIVSFDKDDTTKINNDHFNSITLELLKKLGYSNTPFISFAHTDSKNIHCHILTSTVDFSGKWVDNYNEQLTAKYFKKDYVKKHDLSLNGVEKKAENLNINYVSLKEYSFFKYQLVNSIRKNLNNKQFKTNLKDIIGDTMFNHIQKSNNVTSQYLQTVIGEDRFNMLLTYLNKNKLLNQHFKSEISTIVDKALNKTSNINDFYKYLDSQNVYCRKKFSSGKPYFQYGNPNVGLYFKDSNLSLKYRYDSVLKHFSLNPLLNEKANTTYKNSDFNKKMDLLSFDDKKAITKNICLNSLSKFPDFVDYKNDLASKGIQVILYSNARGYYGISYKNENFSDQPFFKGSQLDKSLSFNSLKTTIPNQNAVYPDNKSANTTSFNPLIIIHAADKLVIDLSLASGSSGSSSSQKPKDYSKRKKKKKNDKDSSNEFK